MKSCPTCQGTYPTHFSVCPQDGSPLRSISELPPGAVIREKYQILGKLGEGGMGVVYKAQHVHFKELFALKLVSSALAQDPTFIQRLNAEALLMRRLDHPHALRVHDIDKTEDGQPFIVMEYVEGEDLASLLRHGPLEPSRAARIVMQACEALGAAHRLGIIHRDIKPTNIMVSSATDGSDHVKVFDFGVAKVKETSPLHGGASLTQSGMVVGTPAYMSPEQCMGARGDRLDGRTDLYSLGIVLYEAVSGRVPFQGDTPMELILAHVQAALPSPRSLHGEIPPALTEVILRALEKDPARRFASAEEMRNALAAALPMEGARTKVDTPMPRMAPAVTDRVVTPPQIRFAEVSETQPVVLPPHTAPGKQREPASAVPPAEPTPMRPVTSTTAPRFWNAKWVYAVASMFLVSLVLTGTYFTFNRAPGAPAAETQAPSSSGPSLEEQQRAMLAEANKLADDQRYPEAIARLDDAMKLNGPLNAELQSLKGQLLRSRAAAPHPAEAFYQSGLRYEGSAGTPRDHVRAARAFRQAAEMGHPEAQAHLGYLLLMGQGVDRNYHEARRLLALSAEKGNAGAMNNLAYMYQEGLGIKGDPVEAYKWYLLAAGRGNQSSRMPMVGLIKKLSPEEIAEGQRRAREWNSRTGALAGKEPSRLPLVSAKPIVAVLPFSVVGQDSITASLGVGVADALTESLVNSGRFRTVERTHLNQVLRELELSQGTLIDPATAQKVGKLLGAEFLAIGSLQVWQGQVRLNARLLRVETGEILQAKSMTGSRSEALALSDRLAQEFLASIP